jgi:hypothetical protein
MKARWREHSVYKGVLIRERVPGTGKQGGKFVAAGTCRQSLESIHEWIDRLQREGFIHLHQTRPA